MTNLSTPITVNHSVFAWMSTTTIWLYRQIKNMENVHSIVFSRQLMNIEQFPWSPLYTMNKYEKFLFKATYKTGRRWAPKKFKKAIQMHEGKILHSHFGNLGWYDLPLATKYNLKHVVTFYGQDVNMLPVQNPVWYKRYGELFAKAHLFLCEGPYMAQTLVELGCPEEKVKVQRLGINLDEIAYHPRELKEGEPIKILIAGAFREKKGIPYALEAIGMLHQNNKEVKVTVIGDSRGHQQDEIEKKKILDVIEKYNMQGVVKLLGFQPYSQMLSEAYMHHIFLSPSVTAEDGDTEGGAPVALIDMMASGMPIVSTTHCDIPEIVQHGRTGLLAGERDPHQLAAHLEWLIKHPNKWEEFMTQGRQHVESNFDAHKQAQLQELIYRGLI